MDVPNVVTPEWVAQQVDRIRAEYMQYSDDERSHSDEDELRHAVLLAISLGRCEHVQTCAHAVLQTTEIEFARWCA